MYKISKIDTNYFYERVDNLKTYNTIYLQECTHSAFRSNVLI